MKAQSKILLAVVALFVIIQFIRPEENSRPGPQPDAIFAHYPAPDNVQAIVKKACYDCHSNNTNYPWYARVQPIAWWINHHVVEGKEHLNFSEFATYKPKKARHKLEEVAEQVEIKEMPMKSYTLIHQEAKLTDEEMKILIDWAKTTRQSIKIED